MKILRIAPLDRDTYYCYNNLIPKGAADCSLTSLYNDRIEDLAGYRYATKDDPDARPLAKEAKIAPVICLDTVIPEGETLSIFCRNWQSIGNGYLVGDFVLPLDEIGATDATREAVVEALDKWMEHQLEMYKTIPDTPVWRIPVTYEMAGFVYVAAPTLEAAIETALDDPSIELPDDADYIDGSWRVEEDADYIRECYNNNEPDCEYLVEDEEDIGLD